MVTGPWTLRVSSQVMTVPQLGPSQACLWVSIRQDVLPPHPAGSVAVCSRRTLGWLRSTGSDWKALASSELPGTGKGGPSVAQAL